MTACTGLDGAERADFRPLGPDRFEYRAKTDLFRFPGERGWAEVERRAWLANYVGLSGLCPSGYRLVSREPVYVYQTPFGYPVYEIIYRGGCES